MFIPDKRKLNQPLQIREVVLNFLGAELSEPWTLCSFYALDAKQVICGWSDDACNKSSQLFIAYYARKSGKHTNLHSLAIHLPFDRLLQCQQRNVNRIL
jgi:hypothetical protein